LYNCSVLIPYASGFLIILTQKKVFLNQSNASVIFVINPDTISAFKLSSRCAANLLSMSAVICISDIYVSNLFTLVIIVALPLVSNCGLPARPNICCTSRMPRSTFLPSTYRSVPLMITWCAGRLTPHASVEVVHSTMMYFSANAFSIKVRSLRLMPALCIPNPFSNR